MNYKPKMGNWWPFWHPKTVGFHQTSPSHPKGTNELLIYDLNQMKTSSTSCWCFQVLLYPNFNDIMGLFSRLFFWYLQFCRILVYFDGAFHQNIIKVCTGIEHDQANHIPHFEFLKIWNFNKVMYCTLLKCKMKCEMKYFNLQGITLIFENLFHVLTLCIL